MKVELGDVVILIDLKKGIRRLVKVSPGKIKIKGVGVFDPASLCGREYGEIVRIGQKDYLIEPPSLVEFIRGIKRKTQLILPKDSALMTIYGNLKPGDIVLEAGVGNGALTIVLANYVRPNGKVIGYEIREEMIKHAKKYLELYGLSEYVEIKNKDVTEGIEEENLDGIYLDIPEPWKVVKSARGALKPFSYFIAYVPTVEQARKTYLALQEEGFFNLEIFETIFRDMIVRPLGTRPNHDIIGHTAYIVVGRRGR